MNALFSLDSLIILIPIFLLSIASCFIIIERIIYFKKLQAKEKITFEQLKNLIKRGNYPEALAYCEENPSPLARLTKVGIENRHKTREELKDVVAGAASIEVPTIERFVSPLGTIANIAPLLGLLGTVTGNIKAFALLGSGSSQSYEMLAPAIGEALYTTAAGLVVAIPSIIFYNFLVNKVNFITIHLENRINVLIDCIGG